MFKVAIPSYRRADVLTKCTLPLCLRWKIPCKHIYIFVVEEELETYASHLAEYPDINIVCGPLGLHHMRNFIANYFAEGEAILHIDDDVKDVMELRIDNDIPNIQSHERYKLTSMPSANAITWIEGAFTRLRSEGYSLFGIYPVKNGYFMKDSEPVTTTLKFCVGVFWGILNRRDMQLHIEEKEDFERTLLCFERDHGILRYNWIAPVTRYYKTPGGMQARDKDRVEASRSSCEYLLNKWPHVCKLYTSKKSGIWEVRLVPPKERS